MSGTIVQNPDGTATLVHPFWGPIHTVSGPNAASLLQQAYPTATFSGTTSGTTTSTASAPSSSVTVGGASTSPALTVTAPTVSDSQIQYYYNQYLNRTPRADEVAFWRDYSTKNSPEQTLAAFQQSSRKEIGEFLRAGYASKGVSFTEADINAWTDRAINEGIVNAQKAWDASTTPKPTTPGTTTPGTTTPGTTTPGTTTPGTTTPGTTTPGTTATGTPPVDYSGEVNNLYARYLNRTPRADEIDFWNNYYRTNTPEQTLAAFKESARKELGEVLSSGYTSVLNRQPGPEEVNYWVNYALDNGVVQAASAFNVGARDELAAKGGGTPGVATGNLVSELTGNYPYGSGGGIYKRTPQEEFMYQGELARIPITTTIANPVIPTTTALSPGMARIRASGEMTPEQYYANIREGMTSGKLTKEQQDALLAGAGATAQDVGVAMGTIARPLTFTPPAMPGATAGTTQSIGQFIQSKIPPVTPTKEQAGPVFTPAQVTAQLELERLKAANAPSAVGLARGGDVGSEARRMLLNLGGAPVKKFSDGGSAGESSSDVDLMEEIASGFAGGREPGKAEELFRAVVEGGQGFLGLEPGRKGSEPYRTGQALSNLPALALPAAAIKGTGKAKDALKALGKKETLKKAAPPGVLVGPDGEPVVIYRGVVFAGDPTEGMMAGAPRSGYATFGSTSPHVASSYANPDLGLGERGAVTPLFVMADQVVEFPVTVDRYGLRKFDKFEFDRRAQGLKEGQVLVARDVVDYGPRARVDLDPQKMYSYGSDVYAFGPKTKTAPAVGKAKDGEVSTEDFIRKQKAPEIKKSGKAKDALKALGKKDAPVVDFARVFDEVDKLPTNQYIDDIRSAHIGGVGNFGEGDAKYFFFRVPGGEQYIKQSQQIAKKNLGNQFMGYRLMSRDEFEALQAGDVGDLLSFSLDRNAAEAFRNFVKNQNRKDLVVAQVPLTPKHVVAFGSPGEKEIIVDTAQGWAMDAFRLADPVRKRQAGSPPEGEMSNDEYIQQMFTGTLPAEDRRNPNVLRDLVRGVTYTPFDLLGGAVDISALLMQPFGYNVEKPVGGSDWFIEQAAKRGLVQPSTGSGAELLGRIAGGIATPGAARGVGRAASKAEEVIAREMQTAPAGVIKLPGGNYLAGEVEKALNETKTLTAGLVGKTPESVLAEIKATYPPEVVKTLSPESVAQINRAFADLEPKVALNKWIDSKLTKYVKNDMATERDPLRLQADKWATEQQPRLLAEKDVQIAKAKADMEKAQRKRGVEPEVLTRSRARILELEKEREFIAARTGMHYTPRESPVNVMLREDRESAGFPREPFATSPIARNWEALADRYLTPRASAERVRGSGFFLRGDYAQRIMAENPWLSNVPPETQVQMLNRGLSQQDTGFKHMTDELRNALNPDSGLPPSLQISVKDLEKMTVPQAANLVDRINAHRAVQKAEADKLAAQKSTEVYKEYPETEQGLRWVEIKIPNMPEDFKLPEGYKVVKDDRAHMQKTPWFVQGPDGDILASEKGLFHATPEEALKNATKTKYREGAYTELESALKYEGDIMQHCVGGYCPDVLSGESRIFSLRDSSGRPHTTIEVKPSENPYPISDAEFSRLDPQTKAQYGEYVRQWRRRNPDIEDLTDEHVAMALAEAGVPPAPLQITQIKGINDRKPAAEYIPFVQDFVKGQKWSLVKDLQNTDLIDLRDTDRALNALGTRDLGELKRIKEAVKNDYITPEELLQFKSPVGKSQGGVVNGYAAGGEVTKFIKERSRGSPPEGEMTNDEYIQQMFTGTPPMDRQRNPGILPPEIRGAVDVPLDILNLLVRGTVGAPVGSAYGVYKGVTGGKYGTPEGVQEASSEAGEMMARITGQPKTQTARDVLGFIGEKAEALKLAPMPQLLTLPAPGPGAASALLRNYELAQTPPVGAVKPRGGLFIGPEKEGSGIGKYFRNTKNDLENLVDNDQLDPNRAKTIQEFIEKQGKTYFTTTYGTAFDQVRKALLDGRVPIMGSDRERGGFRRYLMAGLRSQNEDLRTEARSDFEKLYDQRTGISAFGYQENPADYSLRQLRDASQREKMVEEGLRLRSGGLEDFEINPAVSSILRPESMEDLYSPQYQKDLAAIFRSTPVKKKGTVTEPLARGLLEGETAYDVSPWSLDIFKSKNVAQALSALTDDELKRRDFPEALIEGTRRVRFEREWEDVLDMAAKNKPISKELFDIGVEEKLRMGDDRWVRVMTKPAVRLEGKAQHHSIGGYGTSKAYNLGGIKAFDSGKAQVFSLRSPDGYPRVTVEAEQLADGKLDITQIKGTYNGLPPLEDQKMTIDFLKSLPIGGVVRQESYNVDTKNNPLPDRVWVEWRDMYEKAKYQ